MALQTIKFLETVSNSSATILAGATEEIDLSSIIKRFGRNYNTISITNTATEAITLILDGKEVQFITGTNGIYAFDWEFGLVYSTIAIKNEDGAGTVADSEVKITVGRTGP